MKPDSTPPLTLEEIAMLSAELDLETGPAAKLAARGLDADAWVEIQEQLHADIAGDLDRGDSSRVDQFRSIYTARRDELMLADALPAAAPTDAIAQEEDPAAPASSTPATIPARQLASFQLAPQAPSAPIDPDATAQVDNRKVLEALRSRGIPFDTNAPAVVPAPTAMSQREASEIDPDATAQVDLRAIWKAQAERGIPFDKTEPGDPPTTSSGFDPDVTAPPNARAILGAVLSGGIPFKARPAPPAGEFDPDVTLPPVSQAISEGTRNRGIPFIEDAPVVPPPPLPLAEQSGDTLLTDVRSVHRALAARGIAIGGQASPETPTPTPARSLPRTDKLSLADLEAGARASRAQAEAYAPEPMSIERFAEIQAALTKSRDRDGVLAFYGLALQQWRTVVEQMGNAMNESPALKAQYEQHYRKALQHGR